MTDSSRHIVVILNIVVIPNIVVILSAAKDLALRIIATPQGEMLRPSASA
jgi:hypothetical protein